MLFSLKSISKTVVNTVNDRKVSHGKSCWPKSFGPAWKPFRIVWKSFKWEKMFGGKMFVSDIRTVQGSGRTCLRRRWLHSSWALFKLVLQLARTDLMLDTNRRMTFPIYFILIHLNHLLRILILYTRTERLSFMYCTCTCHKASKILFWGMYEV